VQTPSGITRIEANSLILLDSRTCCEIAQRKPGLAESSTWRRWTQIPHKVIHRTCGQPEKAFSIMNFGAILEVKPSFRAQLPRGRLGL
jgi:hypothetical protein